MSIRSILVCLLFFAVIGVRPVHAQEKVFTASELAAFDGKGSNKAYYAYEGKVYDVTGSTLWKEGEHFGLQAGTDLTGKMGNAPHGTEVFAGFEVVGTYGTPPVAAQPSAAQDTADRPWYLGRIRPFGLSILGWTGIFLGVTFVLNFATCFALPWSKLPLPWKGARPGPDALDAAPSKQHWAAIHKYFAWATVLFGILHGIIGFMQAFWGIYL